MLRRILNFLIKVFCKEEKVPANESVSSNRMTMLDFFGEKELKQRAIDLANSGRLFFQTVHQVIPHPFMAYLNLLCNLVALSKYIRYKYPEAFDIYKNRDKFEQNYRDMKVLLRSFDIKLADKLKEVIKNEPYPIDDVKLPIIVMGILNKLEVKKEEEWLENSIKKIAETTETIKEYSHLPGEKGEDIKKILTMMFS